MALSKDLQIAWRNIWRNRKRTIITVSAVVLAVFVSTLTSSMQEGTYARMIDNIVKFYSGYIQIHHPAYWESKSLNDSFEPDTLLRQALQGIPEITLAVPRLESFALVSSGEQTSVCALIGIDPAKEDQLTGLSGWIHRGHYLSSGDSGIILAVNIARSLEADVGDTLVIISQGYHGMSATALMTVRGILKFPSPVLNNFGAYIDLDRAGEFFSTAGRVTSMVILVKDYRQVGKTAQLLRKKIEPGHSVKTWDAMQPDLVKMIEGDRAGSVIMKGILYMVVGFGMLGTIIMMMAERRREMGVMVAIGMQKFRLQRMLCFESLLIGFTGTLIGVAVSIPIIALLVIHPVPLPGDMASAYETMGIEAVLYFSMAVKIFVNQALTVFVLALMIAVYPLLSIQSMRVIKAMRGQ
jgi:ABC-type lipoprotein release transport system permease subunit